MRERGALGLTLATAATYIGTVVGAGFASGQEVMQFFGLLGPWGLPAAGLTIAGFFVFGYAIMETGRSIGANSHVSVLRETCGRYLAPALDFVITFFLFGAYSAMVAGAGAVLNQEYGVPWIVGAGVITSLTLATVVLGLRGVVTAISAVVPFLLAGVLIVGIAVLHTNGVTLGSPPPGTEPVVDSWPAAGLTYISYNIIMATPVLAVLGTTLRNRRRVADSSLLGALGLGAALILVYLTIVSSFPEVLAYEIPMARLAGNVHRLGSPFYTVIFLAEVYTTAVANLYGFAIRLAPGGTPAFRLTVGLSGIAGLWAASAGFSNLVRVVYPLVGWAGSVFLLALTAHLAKAFRRRRRRR
jgi:uncharacterized membrane protein YkvI